MRRVRQCADFTCHSGGTGATAKLNVWLRFSMSQSLMLLLLAVLSFAWAPSGMAQNTEHTLDEPLGVRFTLEDGVEVRGHLKTWNDRDFDGSFGRRKWTELQHDDLWRLFRQVMNQEDASQWVALGRNLLLITETQPKASAFAERAMTRALELDAAIQPAIDTARAEAQEAHRVARALREAIANARLRTTTPEAADWPSDLWPQLNPQAQQDALEESMKRAEEILSRAGQRIRPFESERFLLYSKLDADESVRWIRKLEALYRHMARQLGAEPEGNLFHGKAIVFLWEDRDRYRLVEADAFKQLVSKQDIAMTHYDDSFVFINVRQRRARPCF